MFHSGTHLIVSKISSIYLLSYALSRRLPRRRYFGLVSTKTSRPFVFKKLVATCSSVFPKSVQNYWGRFWLLLRFTLHKVLLYTLFWTNYFTSATNPIFDFTQDHSNFCGWSVIGCQVQDNYRFGRRATHRSSFRSHNLEPCNLGTTISSSYQPCHNPVDLTKKSCCKSKNTSKNKINRK